MKCPECETKITKTDLKLNLWDREIEVVFTCSECGYEAIIGFSQKDLE